MSRRVGEVSGDRPSYGGKQISQAASVLGGSMRSTGCAELTSPRIVFALVELLQSLAGAADAGLLDHVVQSSALRAASAISDAAAQSVGVARLAQCACGRSLRISALTLANGSITCGVCAGEFFFMESQAQKGLRHDRDQPARRQSQGRHELNP